jgi:hypothetical protein
VRLNRTGGRDPIQGGAWTQVSRLGMPLVNEVVIPRLDKNKWNESEPKDDAQFLPYVQSSELATILTSLVPSVVVPPAPRNDLVTVFLTGIPTLNAKGTACEVLRLNMAIAPSAVPIAWACSRARTTASPTVGASATTWWTSLQVVAGHLVGGVYSCAPSATASLARRHRVRERQALPRHVPLPRLAARRRDAAALLPTRRAARSPRRDPMKRLLRLTLGFVAAAAPRAVVAAQRLWPRPRRHPHRGRRPRGEPQLQEQVGRASQPADSTPIPD